MKQSQTWENSVQKLHTVTELIYVPINSGYATQETSIYKLFSNENKKQIDKFSNKNVNKDSV